MRKLTFALYFGNRGFFPESLIASARNEIKDSLEKWGYHCLIMDESITRYGVVVLEIRQQKRFTQAPSGIVDNQ